MPSPNHFDKSTADLILQLLDVVTGKSELITVLYSVLEGGSEYDLFAKAVLSFSKASGTTMNILRNVVQSEFESNVGTPTAIMRGNTAASRILGLFCREEGKSYLKETLSSPINSIVGGQIRFEIDENKLSGDIEKQKTENLDNLITFAKCVLKSIGTPESILAMPRNIKALAYHIQKLSHKYSPENTMLLVGGFIMLRFINPALLTPDFYHLVPSGSLTMEDRRNLTLLCKLIQNISNQRVCNEEWMLDCNPFIEQNLQTLEDFYVHVLMDPNQENEEQQPFDDLLQDVSAKDINPNAVTISAYKFFYEIFSERKEEILEALSQQDEDFLKSKPARKLMELLDEFDEIKEEKNELELYYSPLCPFSRVVWLFCLETGIPIVTHKIDLLKEDQALDQAYKKFSQLSPSLQTPLLLDGDFVIEESSAICSYLCDKYIVGGHWLPKANIENLSIVHQQLDWINQGIQISILRLWEACKNPSAENLNIENYPDLLENLNILDKTYSLERSRLQLDNSKVYFQGLLPSIVDLYTVLILSFSQLIQGFSIRTWPNLKRVYTEFINKYSKKYWKQINYEFEGFFKYIINVTTTASSAQQIKFSVLFQQTPHTMYEMILDPENDIFLFLASKTISTKAHAKLKRGLKKLNTEGSQENIEVTEDDELPYNVNLEIGGEFNIRGREGTNLLLVPGKKIVQTSRMNTWQTGYTSTVIFEFETIKGSQALLHFTELNCPSEETKIQEDNWLKFWKNINGVRVDTIDQTIIFKTKGPEMMYNVLKDYKLLAKTLKAKMKFEDNGGCWMHNNKVYSIVTSSIENKQIIQDWRSSDWPEDIYASVVQDLDSHEGGCRIRSKIHMVPYDKVKNVEKQWKSNMWKKLGGTVCSSIEQRITFSISPYEVCKTFLDGSRLSTKLKSKCLSDENVGSQFIAPPLKGSLKQYIPDKKIVLNVAHKDWSAHNSIVTFKLIQLEKGTEIQMKHENIPTSHLKSITDMWNNEFWDKLSGIPTTDVSASCILNNTPPSRVYSGLLKRDTFAKIVGNDCTLSESSVGGAFSMYDKLIKGTFTQLDENSCITASTKYFNWPVGHTSEMVYQLDELDGGTGTFFTIFQKRVPINHAEEVLKNCQSFCDALKKVKLPK